MRSGAFIELKRLFLATVVHRIHVDTSIRLATSVDYVHAPHRHSMYVCCTVAVERAHEAERAPETMSPAISC